MIRLLQINYSNNDIYQLKKKKTFKTKQSLDTLKEYPRVLFMQSL